MFVDEAARSEVPFEDALNWSRFSLRFSPIDAQSTCEMFRALRAVPRGRLSRMRTHSHAARQALLYGALMRSAGMRPEGGDAVNNMLSDAKAKITAQTGTNLCYQSDEASAVQHQPPLTAFRGAASTSEVFIIFSIARSASTTFCDNLAQHPAVTNYYELFSLTRTVCPINWTRLLISRRSRSRCAGLHARARSGGNKPAASRSSHQLPQPLRKLFSWAADPGTPPR